MELARGRLVVTPHLVINQCLHLGCYTRRPFAARFSRDSTYLLESTKKFQDFLDCGVESFAFEDVYYSLCNQASRMEGECSTFEVLRVRHPFQPQIDVCIQRSYFIVYSKATN